MQGSKRLFTKKELEEMQKQFLDLELEALEEGDIEKAKYWIKRHRAQQHWFHDSYLHALASLATFIYKHLGEETLFEVMKQASMYFANDTATLRKNVSGGQEGGDEGIRAYIECVADSWRMHFGKCASEEDDEKFIFTQHPCGSGGRLLDMGAYEGPYGYARIKNASCFTWGETDVPIYCIHCAVCHEILPLMISGNGSQIWVHATPCPKEPGDECVHYIYKNPLKIPDKYYKRLGISKTRKKVMDIY